MRLSMPCPGGKWGGGGDVCNGLLTSKGQALLIMLARWQQET